MCFRTAKDHQRLVKHNRSCKRNEQLVTFSQSPLQHVTTNFASEVFTYSDVLFYLEGLNINRFINIKYLPTLLSNMISIIALFVNEAA